MPGNRREINRYSAMIFYNTTSYIIMLSQRDNKVSGKYAGYIEYVQK
jgi:hypothetical protein